MTLVVGPTAGQLRVLSGISSLVVRAVLDEDDEARGDDAFADALRRYREEGAPDVPAPWRGAVTSEAVEHRAAAVLRRLTRDLLKGVSMPAEQDETAETEAVEAPPANVRPIADAREIPALELASDGTWKPSSSTISAQEEIDASARRRSVPLLRSRYPQLDRGGALVLPPAPTAARSTHATELTPPTDS